MIFKRRNAAVDFEPIKEVGSRTLLFNESRKAAADFESIKDAYYGNVVFIEAKRKAIMLPSGRYILDSSLTALLSGRRYLVDASTGNTLGQKRQRRTPGHWDEYYVGSMANEKKCTVCRGLSQKCDTADIFVGGEKVGEAIGSWREKAFAIIIENRMAAVFSPGNKNSDEICPIDNALFCVEIRPGFDVSFITLLTLALRDLFGSK